jgi:hypothetical protein
MVTDFSAATIAGETRENPVLQYLDLRKKTWGGGGETLFF